MKLLWKDFHIKKIIYFFGFSVVGWISIHTFIKDYKQQVYDINSFASLIGIIFSTFILYNLFRTKLTYITNGGIRVGNAPDDRYEHIKLAKRVSFIRWDEIKYINITRHEVRRMASSELISYLTVKTKDGEIHESFIAKPKGFIKALNNLKKVYLVSKDSKYS